MRKSKELTLFCGGCYRKFCGDQASEALREHVENHPCEHYLTTPTEQLIACDYEVEKHQKRV